MSKPKEGTDFFRTENGVIVVNRVTTPPTESVGEGSIKVPDYLSAVDHSLAIDKRKQYEKALDEQEERLNDLVRKFDEAKRSLIVVLQGRDTAGKSGAAERIMQAVDYDPKIFLWVPIGPPTDEEKAHPYLWRFHTGERMPKFGQLRVFDRSWAERLLVEPVMKIIGEKTLVRSYPEVRTYEWLLNRQGAVLVKIWMDITKDEQKARMKERAKNKPWKLSKSDKIARKHWDDYTVAANAMFHFTGTDYAPWHIVASEDKRYSRVAVLTLINDAMQRALADGFKHND